MNQRLRQRPRNKLKISGRLVAVIGTVSVSLTVVISWLVYLNISNRALTKASGNGEAGGNKLNANCEILSEFTWEKNPVTISILGPDAISVSKTAHSVPGGKASCGIAPGDHGKDIEFVIPSSPLFDQDGIDISIDYRRNESSGNFFTRGNVFNFGVEKGFIAIEYKIDNKKGGCETVSEITAYEIPVDPIFRNYRFIYNPQTGKGEIFVNNVIVWSNSVSPNTAMYWKNAGNIIVGKDMDGGGKDIPVFDNLLVRSTPSLTPVAESLINFMIASGSAGVNLHWTTIANDYVNNFELQRSMNGTDFTTIATIPAIASMPVGDEYVYTDKPNTTSSILYYRLRQNFKDGKFVIHPLSGVKILVEKDFCIERVNPLPFAKSFDIAYFTPSSGRVWVQLKDEKGNIRSSETFDTQPGKNIHVYRDNSDLESGTYTLNLIFGEKKVSTKVVKVEANARPQTSMKIY